MTRVAGADAVTVAAKAMTEAQLQEAVTGMLDAHRIPWWHDNDPKRNKPGLPDLLIFGRRVVFWELKRQGERPTEDQVKILTRIARAENGSARVVRPMDLLDGSVQGWVRSLR